MNITIKTEKLKRFDVTPSQYFLLYCLQYELIPENCHYIQMDVKILEDKGYIKKLPFELVIREKGKELFVPDVESWIQDFRDKFKGMRETKPMGDKQGCIMKMKWFVMNYPMYTKEDIMSATDRYLNQVQNREYCLQADYFISKVKRLPEGNVQTSELLSYLEDIDQLNQFYKSM